jgi:hypothetical protein
MFCYSRVVSAIESDFSLRKIRKSQKSLESGPSIIQNFPILLIINLYYFNTIGTE